MDKGGAADLLWCQESHANGDPASLASTQYESFLHTQCLHHLQIHDRSIPIRPVLANGSSFAMSQELNGEKIHGGSEVLVLILALIQLGGRGEGVHEDESRFGGIVGMGHLIACGDAAQMGDLDGLGVGHLEIKLCLEKILGNRQMWLNRKIGLCADA